MIGRQVAGSTAGGGCGELAVLPAASVRTRPEALDERTALALLGQGATAHRAFEDRSTIGKMVLTP